MIDPITLLADLTFLATLTTPAPGELVLRVLDRTEDRIAYATSDPVRTRDLAIGGIRIVGNR